MSGTHIARILREHEVNVDPYRLKSGGIHIGEYGYMRFDNSRSNGKQAGRRLHTLVMEMKLGRPLGREEVVHHIDKDKLNNHPDNLELMTRSDHSVFHHKERRKSNEESCNFNR